jgi:ABC-type multidrug transport system fused ATPase/permease subunit
MFILSIVKTIYLILKKLKEKNIFRNKIMIFFVSLLEITSVTLTIPIISILISQSNKFNQEYLSAYSIDKIFVGLMILITLFFIFKSLIASFVNYNILKVCFEFQEKLSLKIFNNYILQDYSFHTERNSTDLVRVISTESRFFSFIIFYYYVFFSELFIFLLITLLLFYLYPFVTLIIFLMLLFFTVLFYRLIKSKSLNISKTKVLNEELYLKYAMETFGNIKLIKMHSKENYFSKRFFEKIHVNSYNSMLQNYYSTLPRIWIEAFAIIVLSVALTGHSIYYQISIQEMLPILAIYAVALFKIIPSITRLIFVVQFMFNSSATISLVFKELNQLDVVKKNYGKNSSENNKLKFNKKIEIRNLFFKHKTRNKNLFEDLSLSLNKNDFIGITGLSGLGKSTLIDIICGNYKPTQGEILVDGKNINLFENNWKKKISLVSQSTTLLDESLKKNIAFGVNDDDLEINMVEKVLKKTNLYKFVKNLPDGLDSNVGENGVKLSGGQVQRLGIARALYSRPELILLDEPTSSLDDENEKHIYSTLLKLKKEITIIIVSHKKNIKNICDTVYELKNNSLKKII